MKGPLEIGRELCEAWGLDPMKVRSINIDIRPSAMPTVTVELFVGPEHVAALKKYELYARDAGIERVDGAA